MLYEEKIYEGMSVELIVHEGEYKGKYRSRIEEVGSKILILGVPIAQGQFVPLREGCTLEIIFSDDLAVYSFLTSIIKRISRPFQVFMVEYPNIISRIQRRKHVRIAHVQSIKYRILEKKGLSNEKKGFMNDLSGGGMLIATKEELPTGTMIILNLELEESELEVPGTVVRSIWNDEKRCHMVSVEFKDISERTRDRIIRYIFNLQRIMIQKGLG